MINVGVIGYGYWGPNLVRNFQALENCTVKVVCDKRETQFDKLAKAYPNIKRTSSIETIMADTAIDAVVIATPVNTHFEIAKNALSLGKNVLIEKPMTLKKDEALELINLAHKMNKVLMVDHTYLYTPAIQKIKSYIDQGIVGDLQYFDSTRINLGLFQNDVNVLWDLAPHDLSILFYLTSERPVTVSATGVSHTHSNNENIAYLTLKYQSGLLAHFNCSWVSPVKIRSILIGGTHKMIQFNDLEPTEKVKIFDTGYDVNNDEDKNRLLIDYRIGDIFIPKVEIKEALYAMASDFINCIENKCEPISSSAIGLEVIKVLEASEKSIKNNGAIVELTL